MIIKTVPISLYHLPQDVSLGIEFDSCTEDGFHGFFSFVSFGGSIIRNAIFNNRAPDEYGLGKR